MVRFGFGFLLHRTKDQLLAQFPTLLSYSPPAFTRKDREPGALSIVPFKIIEITHIPLKNPIWLIHKISFLFGFIFYLFFSIISLFYLFVIPLLPHLPFLPNPNHKPNVYLLIYSIFTCIITAVLLSLFRLTGKNRSDAKYAFFDEIQIKCNVYEQNLLYYFQRVLYTMHSCTMDLDIDNGSLEVCIKNKIFKPIKLDIRLLEDNISGSNQQKNEMVEQEQIPQSKTLKQENHSRENHYSSSLIQIRNKSFAPFAFPRVTNRLIKQIVLYQGETPNSDIPKDQKQEPYWDNLSKPTRIHKRRSAK